MFLKIWRCVAFVARCSVETLSLFARNGQNKKRGREMKKIAREVLMMIDTQYGTTPKCIEIMTGNSEQEILEAAQSKYGKVHLFPCRLDATIDDANKPHDNKKMRGYGGFGI